MDIVKFPVLQPQSSVGEALKVMKEAQISGVVVRLDDHVNLINYGELVVRRIPKQVHLGNLDVVRTAPIITPVYAKRLKLPMKTLLEPTALQRITQPQRQLIERFLHSYGYSFAVMGLARTSATVLSLSEEGGEFYNATPQDCYCTNAHRPHPYPPSHPGVCKYDGTKIICDL